MKQFNLKEYLQLKEKGKEPKIITRNGQPVRIVCTDVQDERYPILALYPYDGREGCLSCTASGHFSTGLSKHQLDLFFADDESTYRPYKNANEFINSQKKHGPCIKACGQYHMPTLIDDSCIVTNSTSGTVATEYKMVLALYTWQDGSPCGMKEV